MSKSNEIAPRLFTQVPMALNGLGLNSTDKLVFGCIYTMLNVTGKCFMGNARIAENVEVKPNTVAKSLNRLEKIGLINRKVIYKDNSKIIDKRYITLGNTLLENNPYPIGQKSNTLLENNPYPIGQKSKDNRLLNKSLNRTVNTTMSSKLDHVAEREEIINYLNTRTNKHYKPNASKTKSLIDARLKDGFTVDEFKRAIDNKVNDWLNDTKMNKFLRPDTLFTGKLDSYLNEVSTNDMNGGHEDGATW